MIIHRIVSILILLVAIGAVLLQWHLAIGFDPMDARWWAWVFKNIIQTGTLPDALLYSLAWSGAGALIIFAVVTYIFKRPSTRTIHGNQDARNTHGSAAWATWRDVKRAGITKAKGVVIGGFRRAWRTVHLFHDGPEHILAFAPTRSGKGVALVITTLLSWLHSVLVLDIKGEAFALTAGWRKLIGQLVLKFEPAALEGSVRYNPLAEVRIGTDYEIADCQNIASMIIDPDGKGLKDFWMQAGWEWLSAVILHVLYRIEHNDQRTATLGDVHAFMSIGDDDGDDIEGGDEGFAVILEDMAGFDHGRESVNGEVRRAAGRMLKRAGTERSGVHSSATVQLALYSDPIVAANTSESDFRIADLMNGDKPTSLYIVIAPTDLQRLRPLIRILMNQVLSRLTETMEFEDGAVKQHYKHKLLLLWDEFTSVGKLEIFEKSLAFLAGYGIKAFIFIQDVVQLQKEYGREEAITSNCHIRIAYAPNKIETAKLLSELTGKMTMLLGKRSWSHGHGGGNVSDSISEVSRPLMTPDETMALPGIRKGFWGRVIPGDMLIFIAGQRPIYGRQWLYFQDRVLKKRAALPPPKMERREKQTPQTDTDAPTPAAPQAEDVYQAALDQIREAGQ